MKQKHMTKEMRERIEKGIRDNLSLKEIANAIDKDPTTVSKEVLKHRSECVPEYNFNEKPSPCTKCEKYLSCRLTKVCSNECPNRQCRTCPRVDVPSRCSEFVKARCKRLERFPYVCNGCPRRKRSCQLLKYEYNEYCYVPLKINL